MMRIENSSSDAAVTSRKHSSYVTKLRYFLDEHGIRLTWLAKRTGIEYNRLHRLASGVAEATIREGFLIKRVLVCELDQVFDTEVSLPKNEQDRD
jgi:hypothetical protein